LKPKNILCDSAKNKFVVADFGIASFEEDELYTAVETQEGERLANFQYAAPEQKVRGRPVTFHADIYALGLILNQMFTGEILQGVGFKTIAAVAQSCIANWLEVLKNDTRAIFTAAPHAQCAKG